MSHTGAYEVAKLKLDAIEKEISKNPWAPEDHQSLWYQEMFDAVAAMIEEERRLKKIREEKHGLEVLTFKNIKEQELQRREGSSENEFMRNVKNKARSKSGALASQRSIPDEERQRDWIDKQLQLKWDNDERLKTKSVEIPPGWNLGEETKKKKN